MMKATRRSLLVAAVGTVLSITAPACTSRPVSKVAPTTKDLVANTITQQSVDKVDLLFAIDNSQSMGDKQAILKEAVPNLIQGLLTPACVNRESRRKTGKLAKYDGELENNYGCDDGDEPEFKPVTDLHIGVVSSSLGDFGSFKSDGSAKVCSGGRTNDHGHLLAGSAGNNANAPDGFLAWFPTAEENSDTKRHPKPTAPITDLDTGLVPSFQDLVTGVGQDGCGLESQLESVYRFLVQPDPWDQHLIFDLEGKADLGEGVDDEVLRQRADFLRPDSLVAVIMLTDEDDSSSDPLSVNGFGYAFMAQVFPNSNVSRGQGRGTTAPRPTSVCADDPNSVDCTSCGFASTCDANTEWCQKIKQDPNCQKNDGFYAADDDDVNVRFHHMKQRYGVDPQYPLRRYVDGFTKTAVPDRTAEHKTTEGANGKRTISEYLGAGNCTNPLFAAELPRSSDEEHCKLKKGARSPDKVFFAIVGGVPNQLLHFDSSGTPEAAEANRLSDKDWTKILGKDPLHYDYSGIDPHMIQSVAPRKELAGAGDANGPRGSNGSDPVHGREWNTNKRDLQYACTFDLPDAKPCGTSGSCDCTSTSGEADSNTPLCAASGNSQTKAKAYPTIRELELAHLLGNQGVVASLCPLQLDKPEAPDYGYKPAVSAIVERLKNAINNSCLPRSLRNGDDTEGKVDCLVLAQLDKESGQTCKQLGLDVPEDAILKTFKQKLKDEGFDPEVEICALDQKVVPRGNSCVADGDIGWCYVENDNTAKKLPAGPFCPQGLVFSSGSARLTNARFSLQCIQQLKEGEAAGDKKASSTEN